MKLIEVINKYYQDRDAIKEAEENRLINRVSYAIEYDKLGVEVIQPFIESTGNELRSKGVSFTLDYLLETRTQADEYETYGFSFGIGLDLKFQIDIVPNVLFYTNHIPPASRDIILYFYTGIKDPITSSMIVSAPEIVHIPINEVTTDTLDALVSGYIYKQLQPISRSNHTN